MFDRIWYHITEFYYDHIRGLILYSIPNFFYYFKVIYQDRGWDDHYIFLILKRKLENVLRRFSTLELFVGQEKEIKRIKFCINCLNRIIADDYRSKWSDKITEKYGEHKIITGPYGTNGSIELLKMTRTKCNTPELEIEEHTETMKMYECAQNDQDRDIKLLFKVLEKYVRHWWD